MRKKLLIEVEVDIEQFEEDEFEVSMTNRFMAGKLYFKASTEDMAQAQLNTLDWTDKTKKEALAENPVNQILTNLNEILALGKQIKTAYQGSKGTMT